MTLGTAVRRLRQQAGLTQKELARRLNVNAAYLCHVEKDRKEPSLTLLRALPRSLNISPGVLLAVALWAEMPDALAPTYAPLYRRLLELAVLALSDGAQP